ncbi:unnamed protein product [Dicrocoelium dendriticum]|nr:unnamed protein product [Dicrocoelium dendriticum]
MPHKTSIGISRQVDDVELGFLYHIVRQPLKLSAISPEETFLGIPYSHVNARDNPVGPANADQYEDDPYREAVTFHKKGNDDAGVNMDMWVKDKDDDEDIYMDLPTANDYNDAAYKKDQVSNEHSLFPSTQLFP